MWCIVNLPNTQNHAVKCDPKSCGQECLEKVCKALDIICEMEYFGLEHWQPLQKDSRTHQWINLRNRLSQDCGSSNGIQLMLALRVKFWVPVHLILQESVRNIFYMQAKTDLLEGRLIPKDWTNAARLSALLCQADGIRFNETCLKAKCPVRMKQEQQQKEKKDKEPTVAVLTFKKRRLSKQKSIESFDLPSNIIASTSTANQQTINNHNNSHNNQRPQLTHQSYSLGSSSSSSNSSSTSGAAHAAVTTINSILSSSINCSLNNNSNHNNNNNNNASSSSTSSSSSSSSNDQVSLSTQINSDTIDDTSSPLRIYEDYLIRPNEVDSRKSIISQNCRDNDIPEDFLRKIAFEHGKLAKLKMSSKSAKYWLLQEIQELPGYGEEIFSGVTAHESSLRCDIAVGAHGITVTTGDEKYSIPFSAIAAAKSFRRTFKLEYVNDHNERKDLEIKLPKHCIAAGLYRSITERHAFYVCDKVRGVVTNQFTRDLKGTIASMFKEDTELGKRYVFDIQMTCREVHDQARRTLYDRGIEIVTATINNDETVEKYLPLCKSLSGTLLLPSSASSSLSSSSSELINDKVDQAIKEKEDREAAIERYVGNRITEAMTCKICMDRVINSVINPCGHVTACSNCAEKCETCPICRNKITNIVKIFLPTELRGEGDCNSSINSTNNSVMGSVNNTATTSSKVLAA